VPGRTWDGHPTDPGSSRRLASLKDAGVAALVAGLAHVLQGVLLLRQPREQQWTGSDVAPYALFALGVLASLVTVVSLVRCWSGRIGRLTLGGAAVATSGLGLLALVAFARIAAAGEILGGSFILGFLCLLVGYTIFGWAAARVHHLDAWEALLPLAGVVGALVLQDRYGAGIWMGLMWGTLGYRLLVHTAASSST
jgi:hypothetical protein